MTGGLAVAVIAVWFGGAALVVLADAIADRIRNRRAAEGCAPLTIWAGPDSCFERECEEYATEDGDDRPEVDRCSHLKDEVVCARHSTSVPDYAGFDRFEHAEPWPCQYARR